MEVVGDGSAPAGTESKRMDDDSVREEQKQPEEKSPIPYQEFEKMRREITTESPKDVGIAIIALEKDNSDAAVEDLQKNSSR